MFCYTPLDVKTVELDMYGLPVAPARPGRLDRLPWYAKLALVVLALIGPWLILELLVRLFV